LQYYNSDFQIMKMKNINNYNLPNLYIPGAGKSGTSTLHELLNEHPKICMSTRKEPHFWTQLNFNNYTNLEFEEYTDLFTKPNCDYFGESSTGYLCFPEFTKRIKLYYKDSPKFIIILRNPIDRIYSHYWWLKSLGSENKPLKAAILNDVDVEPNMKNKLPEGNFKSYYQFGLYGKWVSKFISEYGRDNLHIITTENLKANPLKTINSCFSFLNLELLDAIPQIKRNQTGTNRFPRVYNYTRNFLNKKNTISNIFKVFIPYKFRQKTKEKINETILKLTKSKKPYPKIDLEERKWLTNLYQKDVELLKKITSQSYPEWKDFN